MVKIIPETAPDDAVVFVNERVIWSIIKDLPEEEQIFVLNQIYVNEQNNERNYDIMIHTMIIHIRNGFVTGHELFKEPGDREKFIETKQVGTRWDRLEF